MYNNLATIQNNMNLLSNGKTIFNNILVAVVCFVELVAVAISHVSNVAKISCHYF
jgi:hypothetical protein